MKPAVWPWLMVLSVQCSSQYGTLTYYVSPSHPADNATCIDNGILLSPCYSLQQLSESNTLLSNRLAVTLLLLPGTHTISQTFTVDDVGELHIGPWNGEQGTIECQLRKHFTFHNLKELVISSLNFTRCTLDVDYPRYLKINQTHYSTQDQSIIHFDNCVFTANPLDYALSIVVDKQKFNVSINNCIFSFNNGAMKISSPSDLRVLITDCGFFNNHRKGEGSPIIGHVKVNISIYGSQFINNSAIGKGLSGVIQCPLLKIYSCFFKSNSGMIGGAINTHELVAYNCTFQDNIAKTEGGAITADRDMNIFNCHFENNSAAGSGGALYIDIAEQDITISNSKFSLNTAGVDGGAIYCIKAESLLYWNSSSSSNFAAENGGFLYLKKCSVHMEHHIGISNNRAENGGAIYAEDSDIRIGNIWPHDGTVPLTEVRFLNNTAWNDGGALYAEYSDLSSLPYSHLTFDGNLADKGGAIYSVDDKCVEIVSGVRTCFIRIEHSTKTLFTNNNAKHGPMLYGGLLDRCGMWVGGTANHIMNRLKRLAAYDNGTALAITSDPVRVCLCIDSKPNCSTRELQVTRVRGQTVELSVAVVDQAENPVTGFIAASSKETLSDLDKGESRQLLYNSCATITYHIYTETPSTTLVLQPEGPCERSPLSMLTINATVTNCTRGFEQLKDRCVCDRRLLKYLSNVLCTVDALAISRGGSAWFRYHGDYLKMSSNCPLDYCRATANAISILSPDGQCAHQRSGVLCGACTHNHSIVLGGSKCLPCTSRYTFIWLVLVFAVAGVALVALLLLCNMTISTGTLNGLIFYANIVSINGLTSLRNCSIHPILSVFMAWLNLDFGVETCFYPGMDTYQKTWFQFAFPLYIILLVVAILVASYYSSRAMRVFGRNNIAILATLFLLSYSKILKTIITALNSTQVLVSSADDVSAQVLPVRVWSYDGNIDYLTGKHVALFLVALLLLVCLFLPYTLLLTFGQCIRSLAARRRWLVRVIHSTLFISIIDAYHAPYVKKHRYWIGFMLLVRCVLFLAIVAFNRTSDIATNMYITALVVLVVILSRTYAGRIYKHLHLDMLEVWFHLNLMVLSLTLCYHLATSASSDSIICKTTSASFVIALITCFAILGYHTHLQLHKTRCMVSIKHTLLNKWSLRQQHQPRREEHVLVPQGDNSSNIKTPTSTMVDLREELLASDRQ